MGDIFSTRIVNGYFAKWLSRHPSDIVMDLKVSFQFP